MTDTGVMEKAIEVIVILNAAVTNLRLYPLTSAMINQSIDRLMQALAGATAGGTALILAESERMLLVGGEPAGSKDQEKPQVRNFVELLVNTGVKSLSFEEGVEKEEITAFLQVLGKKPEEVRAEGGLQEMLFRQDVRHIRIDEKIYVAKDKDQQIVASLDVKDDDIVNFLMEADPDSADLPQIREKASDPEWINEIFQTGMKHLKEQQGTVANIQLSENLVQMVRMLEKIADPADLDRIALLVSRSVTDMDSEMIGMFLSRNVQELFGGRLFEDILSELDDTRFAAVADGLAVMAAASGEQGKTATLSLEGLMKTEKGRKLESERQAQAERDREEREKRLGMIREQLKGLFKEEEADFIHHNLMAELPGPVRELYALEDSLTADGIIDQLTERLRSRNNDVRSLAAEVLSQILNDFIADGHADRAGRLAEKLAGWLRSENAFSSACERICRQLKELERVILEHNPFIGVNPILDIINTIQSGKTPRDPAMQSLAAEALRELATEELLAALFQEFQSNGRGMQKEAARNLGRFGVAPMEGLLDMLRDSEDSAERVRILQVISEIGMPSVSSITERMRQNQPWYVLRNLVYTLGRVGGEVQAADLAPLLLHENPKVQQESLKSLQRIGGKARADILISVLPQADDQFKMGIIEMLGTIKAPEAVPVLADMLKAKAVGSVSVKADLDEKICVALGNMGVESALPALREITDSKGFFAVRSYPEKVKLAAGKAVTAITRREKR